MLLKSNTLNACGSRAFMENDIKFVVFVNFGKFLDAGHFYIMTFIGLQTPHLLFRLSQQSAW